MMCAPFPLLATRAHSPVPSGDIMAQFLQYLPYGEIWRNQQRMGYNERYKYTGKERDVETGDDYFGARHYTSALSGWLSPDPMMDKCPSISLYAYFDGVCRGEKTYDAQGRELK